MMTTFQDRAQGGRLLAGKLAAFAGRDDVVVLALPRGGVPVAFEVARALRAPLDVLVVRKLGVPGHEELAMGAIASGGARVLNDDVVQALGIPDRLIDLVTARELDELNRRERFYRGDRPAVDVCGRVVILVDDGIATGSTMQAAVAALRAMGATRLIVAAPAASPQACAELREEADDCVCCLQPDPFRAVGFWYENFAQTNDNEVRDLLERASTGRTAEFPLESKTTKVGSVAGASRVRGY